MSAIHTLLSSVLPGAFYTALMTPLAFLGLARLFRRQEELLQGGL
jgi:hypothetical protein